MKVLVVSGIWPPDVGGPASHAPEAASFLAARGHRVQVLVTASARPASEEFLVEWVPRSLPRGLRHARAVQRAAALAGGADVVYATGMFGRSSAGALLARRPLVLKLTADPAYERARRAGLFAGSLADFQHERSPRTLPFRAGRDAVVRRAAYVVCPSAFLRELTLGWGADPERVSVLPNPAPAANGLPPREELRARLALDRPTLVFAGRLTAQKSLEVAFAAVERAGVDLLVAGEGPERASLERQAGPTVRFLGPQPRSRVLELYRAADAALLSSAWENFPHAVVEALAVGTPVVSTDVGGVSEVVEDGVNGALAPPGEPEELAAAIARALGDAERLRAAAAPSVERYAPERIYER
ncbi:MAG TPA: glycosyltransferase family 4 protein, partial [Gaiellaceae bacterium]|nr:glycosyltransferase family 4 protein [Gaiellaceae bacterium]